MLDRVRRRRVPSCEPAVEIALLEWDGDGPLALLHHANGFCAGMWDEVAQGIRQRFRVVALDARGHGDSSKPEDPHAYAWERFVDDLLAVAEPLARAAGGRIALGLGHSFGGAAMLLAASRRPELFERLVLVDPVIRDPSWDGYVPPGESPGAHLAARARRRRDVWPSRAAALRRWSERELFASCTPRALELYAAEGLHQRADGQVELKCPREVEAAIFDRGGSLDPFPHVHRVTASTLFLRAARGNFSRETYQALADAMPDARVEDADAGHLVPMERPDLVIAAALGGSGAGQRSTG